jgi:nucleoside-diphosphate-sugar epimerase
VNRVLYIGSASLYQDSHKKIKEEDLDLNTDPPFSYLGIGWVVRYIEKLCEFWHRQTEMEVLIARAANIFGPYAKFNPLTSNFIPAIIRKAVNHDDPFEIWGSPDVTRDVIYSEDFARAITMMMDDDSITYDTFNIGSGIKTTVGDIVKWSLQYAGHHPSKIRYNTSKPTTIRYRELDCSKIQQKFGWKPQYSIEDGVRKTLEWWVKNKEWWKK